MLGCIGEDIVPQPLQLLAHRDQIGLASAEKGHRFVCEQDPH